MLQECTKKIFKKIILFFFGAIVLYLLLLSLFSTCVIGDVTHITGAVVERTVEHTYYIGDNFFLHLFVAAIVSVMVYLIYKGYKKTEKFRKWFDLLANKHRWVIFLFLMAAGISWVMMTQLSPRADQNTVLLVAQSLRQKDNYYFLPGNYMDQYPFQGGIVFLYYFLSFLFGNYNYVALQMVNVVFLVATVYFIGAVTHILLETEEDHRVEFITNLFCIMFFPAFFYITFIYGTLVSLMLALIAVYSELKYFKSRKPGWIFLSSISIGLAIVLKTNSLIMLIAMIIFLIYDLIMQHGRAWTLLFIVLTAAAYLIGGKTVNYGLTNIVGEPVSKGIPKSTWIAMGMQEGWLANGWWNGYQGGLYKENDFNYDKTDEAARKEIKNSLNKFKDDLPFMVSFYAKKAASQWNNPTFECFEIMRGERKSERPLCGLAQSVINGKMSYLLTGFLNYLQNLILAGVLFYLLLGRKELEGNTLIFPVIFIGGFLFHLLWEARGQYTLPYFMLLIPYAAKGMILIAVKLDTLRYKLSKKPDRANSRKMLLTAGILALGVAALQMLSGTKAFTKVIGMNDDKELYESYQRSIGEGKNEDFVIRMEVIHENKDERE